MRVGCKGRVSSISAMDVAELNLGSWVLWPGGSVKTALMIFPCRVSDRLFPGRGQIWWLWFKYFDVIFVPYTHLTIPLGGSQAFFYLSDIVGLWIKRGIMMVFLLLQQNPVSHIYWLGLGFTPFIGQTFLSQLLAAMLAYFIWLTCWWGKGGLVDTKEVWCALFSKWCISWECC